MTYIADNFSLIKAALDDIKTDEKTENHLSQKAKDIVAAMEKLLNSGQALSITLTKLK